MCAFPKSLRFLLEMERLRHMNNDNERKEYKVKMEEERKEREKQGNKVRLTYLTKIFAAYTLLYQGDLSFSISPYQ